MLLLDYLRGVDSTGLAAVRNKDSEVKVVKAAVNPIDLFGYKNFDMVLTGATSKVLIGHNRAATLGKVNNVNAHPFHCGAVVGAHNGTLDRPSWTRLEEALVLVPLPAIFTSVGLTVLTLPTNSTSQLVVIW